MTRSLGLMSNAGPPAPTGGHPRIAQGEFGTKPQPRVDLAFAFCANPTGQRVRQYLTNFGAGRFWFARQRRKRLAFSLNVGAIGPSIGEALANDALGQFVSALSVIHAKRNAVVMTEIKFRQITVQMLLGAMLVRPAHAALEHGEVAFDCVGRDEPCRPRDARIRPLGG